MKAFAVKITWKNGAVQFLKQPVTDLPVCFEDRRSAQRYAEIMEDGPYFGRAKSIEVVPYPPETESHGN